MRTIMMTPEASNDDRYNSRDGWQLVDKETGAEIKVGDVRSTGKGESVTITGLQPPHKASSQGKVSVKSVEAEWQQQFYASVVGGVYNYVGDAS